MSKSINGCSFMALLSLIFGIIGLLTTCIGIGIIFGIAGLVLGAIVLIKQKPGKGFAISGIVLSVLCIVMFIIVVVIINNTTDTNATSSNQSVSENASEVVDEHETQTLSNDGIEETVATVQETATAEETTTIAEETTESAESFKASCQEIGYKDLLRTPDDYVGKRIVITAKVRQVLEGGWLDDNKYYRMNTDEDGYGMYLDDEYFMYDYRVDDGTKILEDDVLKIYAEFAGLEKVKRVLTGSKDEVPAIKAYYIELISE